MITDIKKICQLGQAVIVKESEAIANLSSKIDEKFVVACQLLLNCKGRVVVMGMGKSGHIASKVAATLSSTGTPAFFLHPAEASHGDLGNILKEDVVLAISNSGNTPEILAILPMIKHLQVPLISITANPNSVLAKLAKANLDASVKEEACPLGLVPTSSTTAALAMGDALAITLLEIRGFTEQDFARNHPGGVIGKKLCLLVDDIMRTGNDVPKVFANTTVLDALVEITQKRMGMTAVIDKEGKIIGIYTDGDLRRTLDKKIDLHNTKIKDVMTTKGKIIAPGTLALEALQLMEEYQITTLIVAENEVPVGAIHIHDLLKEGMK